MAKPPQTLTLAPAWRDIIIPEPSEANRPPQHGKRKPSVTTFPRDVKNVLARYLRTCEVFLLDVDTFLQALPPAVKSRQWALTEKIRRILVERQKHLARARQLVKHDVSSSNQRVWGIVSTAVVRREPAQTKLPPEIIDYVSEYL